MSFGSEIYYFCHHSFTWIRENAKEKKHCVSQSQFTRKTETIDFGLRLCDNKTKQIKGKTKKRKERKKVNAFECLIRFGGNSQSSKSKSQTINDVWQFSHFCFHAEREREKKMRTTSAFHSSQSMKALTEQNRRQKVENRKFSHRFHASFIEMSYKRLQTST